MRFDWRSASPRSGGGGGARYGWRPSEQAPILTIARSCARSSRTWKRSLPPGPRTDVVRGEVFRVRMPSGGRGREQRGARFGVVVQADEFLGLSTVLVSPTASSAPPRSFRPAIGLGGTETRVLVEQTAAVSHERLRDSVGRLDAAELNAVDAALATLLGL